MSSVQYSTPNPYTWERYMQQHPLSPRNTGWLYTQQPLSPTGNVTSYQQPISPAGGWAQQQYPMTAWTNLEYCPALPWTGTMLTNARVIKEEVLTDAGQYLGIVDVRPAVEETPTLQLQKPKKTKTKTKTKQELKQTTPLTSESGAELEGGSCSELESPKSLGEKTKPQKAATKQKIKPVAVEKQQTKPHTKLHTKPHLIGQKQGLKENEQTNIVELVREEAIHKAEINEQIRELHGGIKKFERQWDERENEMSNKGKGLLRRELKKLRTAHMKGEPLMTVEDKINNAVDMVIRQAMCKAELNEKIRVLAEME